MLSERDVDGVVTLRRTFQHIDEQEMGEEGKSQPEVLLCVGRCKIGTRAVRNLVIDVKSNSATRTWFRPIEIEEKYLWGETLRNHGCGRKDLCEEGGIQLNR